MYLSPNLAIDEQVGLAIYANADVEKVTITYNPNGGTGEPVIKEVGKDRKFTLPQMTFTAPDGKEFAGWSTDLSGTPLYQPGEQITVSAETTIYAIWKEIGTEGPDEEDPETPPEVEKYTVTYYANGGTGSLPEQQTVEKGQTVVIAHNTLIAPEDKIFKEWNTESSGAGTSYAAGQSDVVVNSKLDLYAIWIDDLVTIHFEANGGEGSVSDIQVLRDNNQVLPPAEAYTAPEGKEFLEWNTTSAGNGTAYDASATIQPHNNMTLYAIWIDKE